MADKKVSILYEIIDKASEALKKITAEAGILGNKLSNETSNAVTKLSSKFKSIHDNFFTFKNIISGFIAGATLKNLYEVFDKNSDSLGQMEAVLSSTGGAAGLTKKAIMDLNKSLSDQYAISETVINSGTNMLLTFKNIKGDQFKDATNALINMNSAFTEGNVTSESLKSQAIQLGKALNDPIGGIQALTRAGIQFSDVQKETIKNFVKNGDVASAQKEILKEIESQFGKSANAYVDGAQKMGVFIEKIKIGLGGAIALIVEPLGDFVGLIGKLPSPIRMVTIALGGLATVFATVSLALAVTPLGAFSVAIGAATTAVVALSVAGGKLYEVLTKPIDKKSTSDLKKEYDELQKKISDLEKLYDKNIEKTKSRFSLIKEYAQKRADINKQEISDLENQSKIIDTELKKRNTNLSNSRQSEKTEYVMTEEEKKAAAIKASQDIVDNYALKMAEKKSLRDVDKEEELASLSILMGNSKLTAEDLKKLQLEYYKLKGDLRADDAKKSKDLIDQETKWILDQLDEQQKEDKNQKDKLLKIGEDLYRDMSSNYESLIKKNIDLDKNYVNDKKNIEAEMLAETAEMLAENSADKIEIEADFIADKRELNEDLSNDLLKIDKDYLNEKADLNKKLTDIDSLKNDKLIDIEISKTRKMTDLDREYIRKKDDLNRDFNTKIFATNESKVIAEKELQENILQLNIDKSREIEDLNVETERKISDSNVEFNTKIADSKKELSVSLLELDLKNEEETRALKEKNIADLAKLDTDYNAKLLKEKEDSSAELLKEKEAYNKKLSELDAKYAQDKKDNEVNLQNVIGQAIKKGLKSQIDAVAATEAGKATAAGLGMAIPTFGGSLLAAAAQVTAIFAGAEVVKAGIDALPFADGGVVPGSSFSGDKIPARLNSSEVVLNSKQQAQLLFKIANNPTVQSPAGGGDSEMLLSEIRDLLASPQNVNLTADGMTNFSKAIWNRQTEQIRQGQISRRSLV